MRLALASRSLAIAVLLAGSAIGGASVIAQEEATPVVDGPPGLPPVPAGCEVIADNLMNPRFLVVADDGTVFVTEAGMGGDEVVELFFPEEETEGAPPQAATPAAIADETGTPVADEPTEEEFPPATRGFTGQVTVITPDGTQSVLSVGFASYSDVGPAGIDLVGDQLYISVGGVGDGAQIGPIPGENSVFQINTTTGDVTEIVELGSFEVANNPDGTDINPNLYGVAVGPDGLIYVADAGGNTIYTVDPTTGTFALFAVVPGLADLTGQTAGPEGDRQPVPTGIAFGPDGTLYVALLGEFWPGPTILSVAPDGTFTEVATGPQFVVDLTVGPDDALYATQLTDDIEQFLPGSVQRIDVDGTVTPVVDGLFLAHGIAFGPDGSLYVTIGSLDIGMGPMGQVVRCDLDAVTVGAGPGAVDTTAPDATDDTDVDDIDAPEATPVA